MNESSGYLLKHGFYYHNHNTWCTHADQMSRKKKGVTAQCDFKGGGMYLAVVSAGQRARANPSWMELCAPILQMHLHLNMRSPNALTYVMKATCTWEVLTGEGWKECTFPHSKMQPRSAISCKVDIVGKCCRSKGKEREKLQESSCNNVLEFFAWGTVVKLDCDG